MPIELYQRLSFREQLEYQIRKRNFEPETSIDNLIDTILFLYHTELSTDDSEYYKDNKDRVNDVLTYVSDCGGFSEFDWEGFMI